MPAKCLKVERCLVDFNLQLKGQPFCPLVLKKMHCSQKVSCMLKDNASDHTIEEDVKFVQDQVALTSTTYA